MKEQVVGVSRSRRAVVAAVAPPVLAVLVLASCSTGSSTASPSSSPFGALAQQALVTQADVDTIAGPGFAPYESSTTASATDPKECLALLLLADGTRSAPPTVVSSATASFSDGSTGASITNTAHVFPDAAAATTTFGRVSGLVAGCSSFSVVVNSAILKGAITPVTLPSVGDSSIGLRLLISSPTTKADVTSQLVRQGRTIVVAVAGTPDGKDEPDLAAKTAKASAAKAASIT